MRTLERVLAAVVIVASMASESPAQRGGGPPHDEAFQADRALFHYLLDHRDEIRRCVKILENGVETVTESENEEVAAKIREHVQSMYKRVEERRPIHRRDPLFAEVFRHADEIKMKVEQTEHGVRVKETSEDPYVAKLIQAHARVVSLFLKNGFREVRKNHSLPKRSES